MADQIPISALPAAPSAQLTDILPVVQSGVTDKESLSQIQTLFNITSTSTLPIAKLNLLGASSGAVSVAVQAAAGTFNFNLPITAGTSGFLLTSAGGGSSAMTWTNPTSISAISSITGTASQVLVNATSGSPQTGAITLTTPQNIATTSNVQFASLGLGVAAIGTTGYLQSTLFSKLGASGAFSNIASHELVNIDNIGIFITNYLTGNMTKVSAAGNNAAIEIQTIFGATSGSWTNADGVFSNPEIAAGANLSQGSCFRGLPVFDANTGRTITGFSNFRSAAPSLVSFAGTLTNMYGFHGEVLNVGTNRYSGYFLAPSGGTIAIGCYADNSSIGYNVTPPSNGLIVSGQSAFGTSTAATNVKLTLTSASTDKYSIFASGTLSGDDGTNTVGCYLNYTLGPINNSKTTIGFYNAPAITPAGSNTINEADGALFALTGTIGSGTVSVSYSAKFIAPTIGTVKVASYHDNISVGYTGITPPTNGALFSGQVLMGTSANTISGALEIGSAGRVSFALVGTKTVTDGSLQTGLYNSPTFAPVSNTSICAVASSYPQFNPPTSVTITTAYNYLLQSGGQAGAGSVTNGINLYVDNPGFGTTKTAIYSNGLLSTSTFQLRTSPTNGYVLTTDGSGNGTWQTVGAVVSSVWPITTVTANYTASTSDCIILVNDTTAARTITLPSSLTAADGKWFVIKDTSNGASGHNITVNCTLPGAFDAALSYTISANYGSVMVVNKVASISYYVINNYP